MRPTSGVGVAPCVDIVRGAEAEADDGGSLWLLKVGRRSHHLWGGLLSDH